MNDSPLPNRIFQSVSVPIDARVPIKIKNKIWNEEFVDFGSLLSNPVHDNKYQLSVQGSGSGQAAALTLEPVTKAKVIQTIDVWMNAFRIFVGVYTRKFPQEAPALMKYGDIVQDLAARGQNWRFYDENFRFLRQNQASDLLWSGIHWELWLRSQYSPTQNKQAILPPRRQAMDSMRQSLFVPRGYCIRFHNGSHCAGNCSFNHACFKCEGMHRAKQCNFRGPAKTPPSKPTAAARSYSTNTNQNK